MRKHERTRIVQIDSLQRDVHFATDLAAARRHCIETSRRQLGRGHGQTCSAGRKDQPHPAQKKW
jgi:hypothetical protein